MRRFATFALLSMALGSCATSPPADGWHLVFAEEFDHDGAPDPTKWDYEQGRVRNGELQYYTRDRRQNARVEHGMLVLEAHHEAFEGATFTAASVITKGRAAFTHGKVEVRAKLPHGRGVWPAIWMLGSNVNAVGWPKCGEVDVMEFVGHDPQAVHMNVHTETYNHMRHNGRGVRVPLADPSDAFHVYGVTWDGERMQFTLDGKPTFAIDNDHQGIGSWPFDAPFYLLMNVAIGGSWGGQQGIDESVFPQRLEIDWVHVYERAPASR